MARRRDDGRVYFFPHAVFFGRLPVETVDGVRREALPLNGVLEHVVENAVEPGVVARRGRVPVELSSTRAEGKRDALKLGQAGQRYGRLTDPVERGGGHLGGLVGLAPVLVVLPAAKRIPQRLRVGRALVVRCEGDGDVPGKEGFSTLSGGFESYASTVSPTLANCAAQ